MKEIPLTRGKTALVDDDDYEELSQHKWYAMTSRGLWYAVRRIGNNSSVLMHRIILGVPTGVLTDHRDGNGLNNQKYNLRRADHSLNALNRSSQANNTTGFKGVNLRTGGRRKPYRATIQIGGKFTYIGSYVTAEEAAHAYDAVARELHGEFACLNFPTLVK